MTIVVNFPPRGAADRRARAVSAPLQDASGQPVTNESKGSSGGNVGGNVGGDAAAEAPPGGCTLLTSSGGVVSVNPRTYPKMSFGPVKDIVPVAAIARVAVFLVVRSESPLKDWPAFLVRPESQPRPAPLRQPGRRPFAAPGHRDREGPDRHLRRARALPRRRAGAERSARRPA